MTDEEVGAVSSNYLHGVVKWISYYALMYWT
jgi:hypothetical protein